MNWPTETRLSSFRIEVQFRAILGKAIEQGEELEKEWEHNFSLYENEYQELASELKKTLLMALFTK